MRIDVAPRQATIIPEQPQPFTVSITNTGTVIGGYTIRVLGADPGWVQVESGQISLFPGESRTVAITVTAPRGIPAGGRRIAVQVRELTPPEASSVAEIDLSVPETRSVQMRVDPLAVTAGRHAGFSVLVENTGNTVVKGQLAGDDAEGRVQFRFLPDRLALAPGEHAVVDLQASARRPLTGAPHVRMLSLYLSELPAEVFFNDPATAGTSSVPESEPAARSEDDALAKATFIQRSVVSRGAFSLVGLLAAITVFALVITFALSRLVGQTAADRDLALQVAAARDQPATAGTGSISGTVRQLTSSRPVSAISVSVFSASDTSTPIRTAATGPKGTYTVGGLAAGDYKISFRGAGFLQLWYPGAATDSDAAKITLGAGESRMNVDIRLGGIPAEISGTVTGDDVSAATLYLERIPQSRLTTNSVHERPLGLAPVPPPSNGEAVVMTVPIGADGTFTLSNVPSPATYDLVATKPGYATSSQRIDIGPGEVRKGVELHLDKGDGLLTGRVTSVDGALGGVTITATSGQSSASTVSLTDGVIGSFTLRSLPTPASFTIVASKDGYASQTLTLSLSQGQRLTGVAISLSKSAGTLSGKVTIAGKPDTEAGGITVTGTDGLLTVQTATDSETTPGGWTISGLPVPGTYTVSFARRDLASQTVSVSLDANGVVSPGSSGATVQNGLLMITMQSSSGGITGIVSQPPSAAADAVAEPLGEATVTMSSGASEYAVTTASLPVASVGRYEIDNLPPGTYTITVSAGSGTIPTSKIVQITAGVMLPKSITLAPPASLVGGVISDTQTPLCGWTVVLYLAGQYPTTPTATTQTVCDGTTENQPGGRFEFAGVDAGTYIVEVRQTPSTPAAASKQVFVQASKVTDSGLITVDTND